MLDLPVTDHDFRADGGKKISGRKCHILVDTTSLLLSAVSYAADIKDRVGAFFVLGAASAVCTRLQLIWADMAPLAMRRVAYYRRGK